MKNDGSIHLGPTYPEEVHLPVVDAQKEEEEEAEETNCRQDQTGTCHSHHIHAARNSSGCLDFHTQCPELNWLEVAEHDDFRVGHKKGHAASCHALHMADGEHPAAMPDSFWC